MTDFKMRLTAARLAPGWPVWAQL